MAINVSSLSRVRLLLTLDDTRGWATSEVARDHRPFTETDIQIEGIRH